MSDQNVTLSKEERCNCPNGSYGIKHSSKCYQAQIEQLREELRKYAFHKGDGEFSHIDYCNYCGYSRSWIASHGHSETCRLRKRS